MRLGSSHLLHNVRHQVHRRQLLHSPLAVGIGVPSHHHSITTNRGAGKHRWGEARWGDQDFFPTARKPRSPVGTSCARLEDGGECETFELLKGVFELDEVPVVHARDLLQDLQCDPRAFLELSAEDAVQSAVLQACHKDEAPGPHFALIILQSPTSIQDCGEYGFEGVHRVAITRGGLVYEVRAPDEQIRQEVIKADLYPGC
jgi:hypothetical protein